MCCNSREIENKIIQSSETNRVGLIAFPVQVGSFIHSTPKSPKWTLNNTKETHFLTQCRNTACPSTSPAPMTRPAASTLPASGPPNATWTCGRLCRGKERSRQSRAKGPGERLRHERAERRANTGHKRFRSPEMVRGTISPANARSAGQTNAADARIQSCFLKYRKCRFGAHVDRQVKNRFRRHCMSGHCSLRRSGE